MTDTGEGEFDVTPDNAAGFMGYQVSIGSSASEALREWRDLGGTATDANWYRLYGQVTDTVLRTPDFLALDPNAVPSSSELGTWSAGGGGMFATQVQVFAVDQETGLATTLQYTYLTDHAHSKEEAEDAALAAFGSDEAEEMYGQDVQGALAIHGWQTVPWEG